MNLNPLGLFLLLTFATAAHAADTKAPAPTATPAATTETEEDGKDADIHEILSNVGYPELQVVPRASERLKIEARAERGNWFYEHWTLEASGFTTLIVGVSSKKNRRADLTDHETENANGISSAAAALGASWILAGVLMGADHPYTTGYRSLTKPDGKKDERAELLRERMAEEALERPARTMRVLQWASVISNAGVNALVLDYNNDKGKVMAGIGVALAFLPLMFTDHSIDVYDKHIEYKKKIYAPMRTGSLDFDPKTKTVTPMQNLVWSF